MKIVKYLEESDLLITAISKKIEHEAKEHKGRFLGTLSSTLGASLLGSIRADKRTLRAGQEF